RLGVVGSQIAAIGDAEEATARLLGARAAIARAFAVGVATDVLGLLEYHLLLSAFGLPAGPVAVVAAIFATGAAHALPVPGAGGARGGAEFRRLGPPGPPPAVGLGVGRAGGLRGLVGVVPGLASLLGRGLVGPWRAPPRHGVTRLGS